MRPGAEWSSGETADPSAALLMTSGAWGKRGRPLKPKEGLNGPPKALVAGVESFVISLSTRPTESAAPNEQPPAV
jgi:hypothetical protein